MIERILLAAALATVPANVFAQNTGLIIRNPTDGSAIRDPALVGARTNRILPRGYLPPLPRQNPTIAPISGPIIRDPTGTGYTRDPALIRDPAGTGYTRDPGFRKYLMAQRTPSYRYGEQVQVGTVLPEGLSYRTVPARYDASGYRFTTVNHQKVIVEPSTRRVVAIIE